MVMTRNSKLRANVVTKSNTDTSQESGQVQHGPTMNELRATIAEEVVRAINLSMPIIFEHVKEITHKVIEDKDVIKKDEVQVKENTTREDGFLVEKEDFSDCMPEFNGLCDPIAALRWIHEMENIFKAVKCADEDKVVYAIAKLRSEARSWWDMVKDTSVPTVWDHFKEMFRDKFCPIRMVMQLEEELLTFKQGSQTVQEYTARFVEMAKYAQHQVATEGRKMERFIRGLRTNIREIVSTKNLTTFQEAVGAAQEVEKEMGKHVEDRNTYSIKRIREGSASRTCTKCRKIHEGDCRYGLMGRHKRDGRLYDTSLIKSKSGPWYRIVKLKDDLSKIGIDLPSIFKKKIGDGCSTRFWLDTWLGGSPLKDTFPRLFRLDSNPSCLVCNRCPTFQPLTHVSSAATHSAPTSTPPVELCSLVVHLRLSDNGNLWECIIDDSRAFSVKMMRSYINQKFPTLQVPPTRWNTLLPLKVNIFIWRTTNKRLPTRANLDYRGIDLDSVRCPMCDDAIETEDHIFVSCSIAKDTWKCIAD
nr:hypothetical protein [Tanacetum cinerariifolium]